MLTKFLNGHQTNTHKDNMKTRNSIVTDAGIVIDPDDDAKIVSHENYYEIIYDNHVIYCDAIYPTD